MYFELTSLFGSGISMSFRRSISDLPTGLAEFKREFEINLSTGFFEIEIEIIIRNQSVRVSG